MAKNLIPRSLAIKKRQIEVDVFNFISLRRGVKERKARSKYKELFTYTLTKKLNKSQQKVATSFAPETLVVAGAGTGKTSALLGRAKYLITDERVTGPETLLLAFNKKAAEEIAERAEKMDLDAKRINMQKVFQDLEENLVEVVEFYNKNKRFPWNNEGFLPQNKKINENSFIPVESIKNGKPKAPTVYDSNLEELVN